MGGPTRSQDVHRVGKSGGEDWGRGDGGGGDEEEQNGEEIVGGGRGGGRGEGGY